MNHEANRACRLGGMMRLGVPIAMILMIPGIAALAQDMFSVQLNNRSHQTVYVVVYDHTCRTPVFEGRIRIQSMKPITVCRGASGKGLLTVYDRRGRKITYRDVVSGGSINVRFR